MLSYKIFALNIKLIFVKVRSCKLMIWYLLFQVPKMSKEVAEEYLSSLADLTVNSKPLINMLTMLADENVDHAPAIVQVIENHLEKVI